MSFCLEDQKGPAPRPQPLSWGLSFLALQVAIRVSNFAQTATAKECKRGGRGTGVLMSETDQFWECAKEAMLSASTPT